MAKRPYLTVTERPPIHPENPNYEDPTVNFLKEVPDAEQISQMFGIKTTTVARLYSYAARKGMFVEKYAITCPLCGVTVDLIGKDEVMDYDGSYTNCPICSTQIPTYEKDFKLHYFYRAAYHGVDLPEPEHITDDEALNGLHALFDDAIPVSFGPDDDDDDEEEDVEHTTAKIFKMPHIM